MQMMRSLTCRQREAEWMDAPDVDPELLRRSLKFIRRINALLGYTRATLSHLKRFSRQWKPGERITILDVATGSGDVPAAILKWAKRRGFDVRIVGIDLHEQTARTAAENTGPRFSVMRGNAVALPFADGSFDYVLTSMFLHHLDDDVAVAVLREMNRVARRGLIATDLLRNRRAYAWITLFTLWANPMVKHDARVSVAQAFSLPETLLLQERAGLAYTKHFVHFAHRFALAGERDASHEMAHAASTAA
jgi:SAM-dependent methyltransferase